MDVFREISLAYFSPSHLAKVSATCRTLRALASDIMHWRNKVLFLEGAEFQSSEILQRISPAYGVASAITVTCKQLCLFDTVPSNAYVTMQTECIRLPGATDAVMSGFRSTGPLMGRAELDLILPRSACGIYIGVREWRGARRSYCRIDNLFQNNTTWSYGLNGEMPRPHFGRERHQILPLSVNRFEIEWSSHSFEIWLNRAGVSRVFTNMEAAPHLSELFVWVYRRDNRDAIQPQIRSLPSRLPLSPTIKCAICSGWNTLTAIRWCVCDTCYSWVCRSHVLQHANRLCPRCPAQLGDFLGAASGGSAPTTTEGDDFIYTKRVCALAKKARRLVSGWTTTTGCAVPIRSDAPKGTTAKSPTQFLAPVKQPDTLALLNPHRRDSAITFESSGHRYLIRGVPTNGSVTGMVHHFAQDFVEEAVIEAMQQSVRWPRPSYLREEVLTSELSVLAALEPGIVIEFLQRPRNEVRLCGMLWEAQQRSPDVKQEIAKLAMSKQDILLKWQTQRDEAAAYGTYVHYLLEAFLNGFDVPMQSPEFQMFLRFLVSLPALRAYRTEWVIYGDLENIAGTIDFCATDARGRLYLFDWKRSAGLQGKYKTTGSSMKKPLQHLADQQGIHYRLQLNCYRFLLEKYYAKEVAAMFVVCVHPDNSPQAFVDSVPILHEETRAIMKIWEHEACRSRSGDVSGGSGYAADLPQDVLLSLATCFTCPDYLQRFQACSRSCRRAVLDPTAWQGQVIDMEPQGPNLAQFLRAARLVRLWSRAEAVILPAGRLSKIPHMLQNMRIGWRLEYKAAQDVLNTLRSYLWESSRPLFGQAEFSITMKHPATALIVGARGTDMRTGMFRSIYCRFQRPFQESMSAAYGMYGEHPMPVTCQRGPQLRASATHHVKVAWSEGRLTIWLDGCLQPSLQLRPQTPSGPRPHSTFFAKIFALPNSGRNDFLLRALPSKIEQQCIIKCHSCMYTSRLTARGCLLCDQCLHWFCFRHIQIAGSAAFCAPCAETVIDVLGGATSLKRRDEEGGKEGLHIWQQLSENCPLTEDQRDELPHDAVRRSHSYTRRRIELEGWTPWVVSNAATMHPSVSEDTFVASCVRLGPLLTHVCFGA